ncbi:hypothetical protein ACGF0J_21615 [Nonomuraea sp. NPDC047897]|uniref:hypothetical protein n=1 Tax=Nonomuraea sp. NPDC047897 TaxID=3364346 RepID=UPI003721CC42
MEWSVAPVGVAAVRGSPRSGVVSVGGVLAEVPVRPRPPRARRGLQARVKEGLSERIGHPEARRGLRARVKKGVAGRVTGARARGRRAARLDR